MRAPSRLHRLCLAGALAWSLAALPSAQTPNGKVFAKYHRPLRSVELDLDTGTVTYGPAVRDRGAPTVTDFDNMDTSGFVGVDTGGGTCQWFDAAIKGGIPNASDLVNSIVFAYCSSKLGVPSGGPGGSVGLGFYEGYVLGGGAPTTAVCVFSLTGLPANTGSSSFFGGFQCYYIRITYQNLKCFADGPIGYSWKFADNGTGTINPQGSVLAGTWPFLCCVVSCSGALGQIDGKGMTDFIDEYCPPGFLLSTFTFGTSTSSYTSMCMGIEEVRDKCATVISNNSITFPNPDTLTTSPAIAGQFWTATVTNGLNRASGPFFVFFGTTDIKPVGLDLTQFPAAGYNFGNLKNGRMLICAPPHTIVCSGVHGAGIGGTGTCGGAIPKRLSLVCNQWCVQALIRGAVPAANGGGIDRLTNAVKGIVGTYACPPTFTVSGDVNCDNTFAIYTAPVETAGMSVNYTGATGCFSTTTPTVVNFTTTDRYLYIACWSDDATGQGLLHDLNVNGFNRFSSHPSWRVTFANSDVDTCAIPGTLPASLNALIPTATWLVPTLGCTNPTTGNCYGIWGPMTTIASTARWSWYNSGTQGGANAPFQPGWNHGEFLIFRLDMTQ